MIELKDELCAAPVYTRQDVPITANRHLWRLQWYRWDDEEFFFAFYSPKKRRYSFFVERWPGGRGKVTEASVTTAHGESIASYRYVWGDGHEGMDDVIRLTPKHILRKLSMLLDAIG